MDLRFDAEIYRKSDLLSQLVASILSHNGAR